MVVVRAWMDLPDSDIYIPEQKENDIVIYMYKYIPTQKESDARLGVVRVPELAGDEQVLPRDDALVHDLSTILGRGEIT